MAKHGLESCEYGVKRSPRSQMDEKTQPRTCEDVADYSAINNYYESDETEEDSDAAVTEEVEVEEEVSCDADVDEENDEGNSESDIACDNC